MPGQFTCQTTKARRCLVLFPRTKSSPPGPSRPPGARPEAAPNHGHGPSHHPWLLCPNSYLGQELSRRFCSGGGPFISVNIPRAWVRGTGVDGDTRLDRLESQRRVGAQGGPSTRSAPSRLAAPLTPSLSCVLQITGHGDQLPQTGVGVRATG